MLFTSDLHDRIRHGDVTVAFRRWRRPTVSEGGTLQSPAGLLQIDEVTPIDVGDVTEQDARAAGSATVEDVLAPLRTGPDRQLHRIRFHRIGDDPRVALRDDADLGQDDLEHIDGQLARWDRASRSGPWTRQLLDVIADQPAVRSADLADQLGVEQRQLKRRVRQLKQLGLTESLDRGYRLAPRGEAHRAAGRVLGRDAAAD